MKKIHKYELPFETEFALKLPEGAQILSFQSQTQPYQGDIPVIWVLGDIAAKKEETRLFRMVRTSAPIEDAPGAFIGTAQFRGGGLVLHLFERPR